MCPQATSAPCPQALPVTRGVQGSGGGRATGREELGLTTTGINSNVSSAVIIHSVSIFHLEGPGTGALQSKARPGSWLQGAYDPVKGQSWEHIIVCSGDTRRKEAFVGLL